jgi:hypothetical protein
MSDEKCVCPTCGFEWVRGQDGSHLCSTVLCARVKELEVFEAAVATLVADADAGSLIEDIKRDRFALANRFRRALHIGRNEKFVVVAGKYERSEDAEDDGRNYKFSGEPKANLTEAITELVTVSGYPFSEIEFCDANGKHWIVGAYPDTRPRLDTCKHCGVKIVSNDKGLWLNTQLQVFNQYCFVDPQGGSKLHEPE